MSAQAHVVGALSEHTRHEIDRWLAKFPPDRRRSAVIAALREAQHQNDGYLTAPLMDAVAEYIGMPADPGLRGRELLLDVRDQALRAACTFRSAPTSAACCCGADEIVAAVEKHLGIRTGESTPDGRIYLKREEECLAACNNAPMMMVDHVYHENLTPESAIKVLDGVK